MKRLTNLWHWHFFQFFVAFLAVTIADIPGRFVGLALIQVRECTLRGGRGGLESVALPPTLAFFFCQRAPPPAARRGAAPGPTGGTMGGIVAGYCRERSRWSRSSRTYLSRPSSWSSGGVGRRGRKRQRVTGRHWHTAGPTMVRRASPLPTWFVQRVRTAPSQPFRT